MVKSYLKFEHAQTFGLITSSTSNLVWTPGRRSRILGSAGNAVVAANEDVLVWDIKKAEVIARWREESCHSLVTCLARSSTDADILAAGYEDGSVRLWDAKIGAVVVAFNGHKSAVVHLAFDRAGVRLATGSKDTDVILWDLVAETGLYKLRGHKDQITGLRFVEPQEAAVGDPDEVMVLDGEQAGEGYLLTTGKDALIKLWDLALRHCVETQVAQTNGECWALGVSPDLSGCITAGNDGELKVWSLDVAALVSSARRVVENGASSGRHFLQDRGTLHRQGKDRAVEVVFHPKRDYFAVHGVERPVEIWRIRSETEVKKSLARKRKRRREKLAAGRKDADTTMADTAEGEDDVASADVSDVFVLYAVAQRRETTGKVRSVDWALNTGGSKSLHLLMGTTDNQLELYTVPAAEKASKAKKEGTQEFTRALGVELAGHRTDMRALAISSDDRMLASAANKSLKVWNIKTQTCIRTFECGYALCCAFLPGDKVVVVGTREGDLQLFDVASSTVIESVAAHEKSAVWSLQVHPNGRSVVSGGADKTVRLWECKVVQEAILGTTRTTPRLTLIPSRILKLSDDILCVRLSPDARLLAVALMDSTVRVFFTDSLQLYLNLYGHKLPVLSMDISFDSKLIVTSSADKNIRIWGLDFGDCHKALFGHQDSILQVGFVPHNGDGNGHHFFSCGKDRAIKYWDGDKFEQIQRIDGHHGEIWALAIAHSGRFFVSASHDKSIRVWVETDEQIFLEEERERELEALYENTLAASLEAPDQEGDDVAEVGAASKPTTETLMAGERLMEALDLGIAHLNAVREWQAAGSTGCPPQRSPILIALGHMSAEQHVLFVLSRIKPAALHDALLVLPFAAVPSLFTFIDIFAHRGMAIPLTCRVLFFMLRTHHRQIVASRTMRAVLAEIRVHLRATLRGQRDEMGYNLAALRVVGMQVRERSLKAYVGDVGEWEREEEESAKGRKRGFVSVA